MRKNGIVITIDGPAGVGKTTVSKKIADEIGYSYTPTGFIYRAVAYAVLQKNISLDNNKKITETAQKINIAFGDNKTKRLIFVNNTNITDSIKAEKIGNAASIVSQIQGVRDALFDIQKKLGESGGVVMEGRDMGTVLFPDAEIKFFLTASITERAKRRFNELTGKDPSIHYGTILKSIKQRDNNDKNRSIAPLAKAKDAVLVDNTHLSIDDVVMFMLKMIHKKLH